MECRRVLFRSEGIDEAVAAIAAEASEVHILVNNAGTFTAASIDAITPAQWDRELGVNLRAPFFLVQGLLPQLTAAPRAGHPARVINIGTSTEVRSGGKEDVRTWRLRGSP